jgi:phosphatidylglycerol lysyltransferase
MKTRLVHIIVPMFGVVLFTLALWVLYHQLKAYHLTELLRHLKEIPARSIFLAFFLTVLSYLVLTGYDALALRYIKRPLSYSRIALASFVGYTFSNNIGFGMLAGGSVRYRLYSLWGLSVLEITKVVVFCSLTVWLGFLTLGGLVFFFEPVTIPATFHFPFVSARPLGAIFLLPVGAYILIALTRKRPFKIRDWTFPLPTYRLLTMQISVALADWTLAGSVLYALLPPASGLTFSGFLGIYLLSQVAGLVSQVPGGLGVFETVVILLLSGRLPASEILGPLLVYRGMYYILPLLTSAVLLALQEFFQRKETLRRITQVFGRWVFVIVPQVLSVTIFMGGAILLFSGATPAVNWRLAWLKDFIPLPVIEISHFLGSLAGVGLLLLARGLQRRIDAAYLLTAALLGAGILFSLLKGLDYEEAIALSIMLIALLPCRRYFYRKGSLISQMFSPGWMAAIVVVLICSAWLGFFSHKHVEYSSELWWRFELKSDAPRFLRALVGTVALMLIFIAAKLLRPKAPRAALASRDELSKAASIISSSRQTYANLAFLGDKTFLFSRSGRAFIMYGIQGRSWIAMGDPIGEEDEWPELLWQFREMCDQYDGWSVFYEVGHEKLHIYLDLGLNLLKLGEEARVPLEDFSLEGSARKGLRYTHRKLEKEGCRFEVVPPQDIPPLLSDLRSISDAWLEEKNTREKGFSLGFFDENYLKRFPAGLIRKEGKVIAFANMWLGAEREELSIDLMRYAPGAPDGAMEYLFIQLMLWGHQEGYRWFSLGMAPLSGLEDHDLAPLWHRLGDLIYRYGEHFYNLQGLRQYKEKFNPEWTPKYLASPGGLALPRILANIASLISGGLKGVIAK